MQALSCWRESRETILIESIGNGRSNLPSCVTWFKTSLHVQVWTWYLWLHDSKFHNKQMDYDDAKTIGIYQPQ